MRTMLALPALVAALWSAAADPARADEITLADALARAAARPSISAATAELDATRAEAAAARRSPYNPELDVAVGPKRAGGTMLVSAEAGLSQRLELGGKAAARRDAADAIVRATDAERAVAIALARGEAWRAYQLAAIARQRLAVRKDAEQIAVDHAAATEEERRSGAGTQLRVNLAGVEVGRARQERSAAEIDYLHARAELAAAIGAGLDEHPEPVTTPIVLPAITASADARTVAWRDRPTLVASRARVEAAGAEVRLADALAVPDLVVGLRYAYDPDPDDGVHVVLLTGAIELPVRTRGQGARAAARARARRAAIDDERARVEVERTARLAVESYARAKDAIDGFDREVAVRLDENLAMAQDAYRGGAIDFFAYTVTRRELIEGRLAYLDALAAGVEAWAAVERAGGREVTP